MTDQPGAALTDGDLRDLTRLLARYVEHDLDQFEDWQLQTTHGPVYVTIRRELPSGWPAAAFTQVWPPQDSTAPRAEDASGG
ncbi:hypothetical protein [Spirilliplanes yamanashiensis]|uniref:Uncharacterized protein n=1 Tax=Spirilliplanes yamanashiensis TaxID=42233 RepID=A0A8J4DLF6_9ACTN|nr:hypothetical protein [Spirilliplanes yamanashiensis]MDP9816788.1 hypothetical protein [Spirilliplanes yamanashiensis]GIJ06312.1 hypothetical protein Sya03_56640 [Spirilliplanes yamanashiensis]